MEEKPNHPCYPTNWDVRFLCDCRKSSKEISLYKGIAQKLSIQGICILSGHHICQQKKIAMQLMIPSLLDGTPQHMIKIIGHTIVTNKNAGLFLTEIDFLHFEEDGERTLAQKLRERFDRRFLAAATNPHRSLL